MGIPVKTGIQSSLVFLDARLLGHDELVENDVNLTMDSLVSVGGSGALARLERHLVMVKS